MRAWYLETAMEERIWQSFTVKDLEETLAKVPEHLRDFLDVFSEAEFQNLPERQLWDHAIDLKEGFKPAHCKVYPLNPSKQQVLDAFLEENLKLGWI